MTLKTAIKNKKVGEIRKITKESPLSQIVDMLEELSSKERVLFFRLLNSDLQTELFSALEPEYQEQLIRSFTDKQMDDIVGEMYSSDIADLVEEVPDDIAKRILKYTDKETRQLVNKILKYDDDHTGSIMNVDIVPVKQTLTVSQARKLIRENRDDARISHYFFVVDSKNKLVGHIVLEDLMFEDSKTLIKKIKKPVMSVYTTTDKEEAANIFAEEDMSALPVVNKSKELIGMITAEEVIDIIQDEATEDISKMAGIDLDASDDGYSKQSTGKIFRSRVFWLMFLMISATLSQIVLDVSQTWLKDSITIVSISTAIIAILPVISGAAGNAGSQSSATVIRALATGDITTKDYLKVLWKESKVSFLIGLALGVANFLRLLIYFSVTGDFDNNHIMLSLAASLALMIVIMLAKIVGGTLPLLAKKLNKDPAVMAAPLLTTLIDALSTGIFFSISIGIMLIIL